MLAGNASAAAAMIASNAIYVRGNYCAVASRALFLWDYLVTVEDEVHYFWGRKITAASVLFLLNRYVNLAITILQFFSVASFQTSQVRHLRLTKLIHIYELPDSDDSCGTFVRVVQALLALALTITGGFAAVRVYAIWHRSLLIALPVLILAMVPPILTIFIDVHQDPALALSPSSGCAIVVGLTLAQYTRYANTIRCCTIAYDALVFILTVLRTWQLERDSQIKTGLAKLIIRDGCLYFACLTLLNTAQLIITFTSEDINYPSYFLSPLTSILISRFLLNLCKVAHTYSDYTADTSLYLSSGAPSVKSSSDIFFDISSDLKEVSLLYSDTLRSHGTSTRKDIELKSYTRESVVSPSIVTRSSAGDSNI